MEKRSLKKFKKNVLLLTLALLTVGCISVLQASNKSAQKSNNSINSPNIIIKDPFIGDDAIINDNNIKNIIKIKKNRSC